MDPLRPVRGTPAEVTAALESWLGAADPAPLVVETSGSSGAPKRVLLSRDAVVASARATATRLGAEGRWLLALPVTYVAGLQVVVRSLLAGRPPVTLAEHASLPAALEDGGDGAPAFASLVPTQLHRWLDDVDAVAALRSLHTVLVGGGPVDPALRERAAAAGVRVVATYGASETAGGCVYDGRPLDGVEVALGEAGRVHVAGPVLFAGYESDPTLTAEALVDGWFRTADAGELGDDGRLRVLGRVDDVVVTGGVNVPGPAVAARLRAHPAVTAAEVVGVPDPEWGRRLVAFVVGPVSLPEARDWVSEAHPRTWAPRELHVLDELPLLATGKPDRQALLRLAGATA